MTNKYNLQLEQKGIITCYVSTCLPIYLELMVEIFHLNPTAHIKDNIIELSH